MEIFQRLKEYQAKLEGIKFQVEFSSVFAYNSVYKVVYRGEWLGVRKRGGI